MHSEEEPRDPLAEPPGPGFVRTGVLFYGAMAIVAVLWRSGLYGEPIFFSSAETAREDLQWGQDLLLGAGVGALIVLLSSLATRLTDWGEDLARAMADAMGPISVPDAILLAVASGMAEEMFFRGALQPRVGLLMASVLFGVVHFVPRREFLPWTAFALCAGVLFGALFEMTGNLIAPIVAHAVVNGVNLPLLVKQYGSSDSDGSNKSEDS
jgi:membrane protease YdiL (CAAX protease family)